MLKTIKKRIKVFRAKRFFLSLLWNFTFHNISFFVVFDTDMKAKDIRLNPLGGEFFVGSIFHDIYNIITQFFWCISTLEEAIVKAEYYHSKGSPFLFGSRADKIVMLQLEVNKAQKK